MKKIIDGKRYDTETATLLGTDSYSNSQDFRHWTEKLYRKRNGEYFLYGEGGPKTQYAQTIGQNEWRGGEKIMPLTVESAREWAEKHLSANDYEEAFGAVKDDDSKIVWSVNISPATIERVKRIAGAKSITLSEVIEQAVVAFFEGGK